METLKTTRDFIYRKCTVCGVEEQLPRAGKIDYYSVEADSQKNFERREKAKELLQPAPGKYDSGPVNELFEDAYGNPFEKKSKVGQGVEKMRIKGKTEGRTKK